MVLSVVVLGDKGCGKTSLIAKWCAEGPAGAFAGSFGSKDTPDCLRPVTVPASITSFGEDICVADTNGDTKVAGWQLLCERFVKTADAVIIVSSCVDAKSQASVKARWIPYVERVRGVGDAALPPVICVRNKADLSADSSVAAENSKDAAGVHGPPIDCSAKTGQGVVEVFQRAVNNALNPLGTLLARQGNAFLSRPTRGLHRALAYLFRQYDRDGDGLLNRSEWTAFSRDFCASAQLIGSAPPPNVKEARQRGGVSYSCVADWVAAVAAAGEKHRVWQFLKSKGFDRSLKLGFGGKVPEYPRRTEWTMSQVGFRFLTFLFLRYDRDNDRLLSPDELDGALFPCPRDPFRDLALPPDGVSLAQWHAAWGVLAACRPAEAHSAMLYLGFKAPGKPLRRIDGEDHQRIKNIFSFVMGSAEPESAAVAQAFFQRLAKAGCMASGTVAFRTVVPKPGSKDDDDDRIQDVYETPSISRPRLSPRLRIQTAEQQPQLKSTPSKQASAQLTAPKTAPKPPKPVSQKPVSPKPMLSQPAPSRPTPSQASPQGDEKSKADSSYYFFKSTDKDLAKQYAPRPIKPGQAIPLETPRLPLSVVNKPKLQETLEPVPPTPDPSSGQSVSQSDAAPDAQMPAAEPRQSGDETKKTEEKTNEDEVEETLLNTKEANAKAREGEAKPTGADPEAKSDAEAEATANATTKGTANATAEAKVEAEPEATVEANTGAMVEAKADAGAETTTDSKSEAKPETKREAEATSEADAEATAEGNLEANTGATAVAKVESKAEAIPEAKLDTNRKVKAEAKAEVKTEAKTEVKTEVKAEATVKAATEAVTEAKVEAEAEATPEATPEASAETKEDAKTETDIELDMRARALGGGFGTRAGKRSDRCLRWDGSSDDMAEFDRSITGPRSTLVFLRMATEPVPVGCDRAILVSEKNPEQDRGRSPRGKDGEAKTKAGAEEKAKLVELKKEPESGERLERVPDDQAKPAIKHTDDQAKPAIKQRKRVINPVKQDSSSPHPKWVPKGMRCIDIKADNSVGWQAETPEEAAARVVGEAINGESISDVYDAYEGSGDSGDALSLFGLGFGSPPRIYSKSLARTVVKNPKLLFTKKALAMYGLCSFVYSAGFLAAKYALGPWPDQQSYDEYALWELGADER